MPLLLNNNIDHPNSKYLVFTSAGDHANLDCWLKGYRNFDLWVSYYGDEQNRYKDHSDFYIAKKGGKFPNLHYVYQHWENILNHYEAILVMDDDIIIDGCDISRLFEIREQYDLWLLQPAFNPMGKISHPITRVRPLSFMRYTNFVEVTCPLFRRDKLDNFMKVYDPVVVGWGIDWWYLDLLGPDIREKVGIVDEVSCINPHDLWKGGEREIDRLQNRPERKKNWKAAREQYNVRIREFEFMEFNSIRRPLNFSSLLDAITITKIQFTQRLGKINNLANRFTHR